MSPLQQQTDTRVKFQNKRLMGEDRTHSRGGGEEGREGEEEEEERRRCVCVN